MKVNLKMVTWEVDLTQFLVDAETDEEAIEKTIKSNLEIAKENDWETDGYSDKESYTVVDVDFNLLKEIFHFRDDYWCVSCDAIVFGGA